MPTEEGATLQSQAVAAGGRLLTAGEWYDLTIKLMCLPRQYTS